MQDSYVGVVNDRSLLAAHPLFDLIRYFSRRSTEIGALPRRGRLIHTLEAVATVGSVHGATVNDVADELGVDQSGASRLIARAEHLGYLRRSPDRITRRTAGVVPTESGERLLDDAREWQHTAFGELTASWARDDALQLERLLHRLSRALPLHAGITRPD